MITEADITRAQCGWWIQQRKGCPLQYPSDLSKKIVLAIFLLKTNHYNLKGEATLSNIDILVQIFMHPFGKVCV